MIVPLFLFFTITASKLAASYHRPNHFGNPCVLCKCFIKYTDRDKPLTLKPYGAAANGYDTTEDQCLKTCLKDTRCKAVVYGFVGGRDVFTCELYETTGLNQLVYVPFVNTYLPRKNTKCNIQYDHIKPVHLMDRQQEVINRKLKYQSLLDRRNPFYFG